MGQRAILNPSVVREFVVYPSFILHSLVKMLFNPVAALVVATFAFQAIAAPYAELEPRTCTAATAAVRKDWYV